jgi:hypothetical protein
MNPPDQFAKDYLRPVFKSDQPTPATAPTPRTDAATKEHTSSDIFFDYVLPQDMATLERELYAACSLQTLACRKWDAAERKLTAEREKVRVLREACKHVDYLPRIRAALAATEVKP